MAIQELSQQEVREVSGGFINLKPILNSISKVASQAGKSIGQSTSQLRPSSATNLPGIPASISLADLKSQMQNVISQNPNFAAFLSKFGR